MSVERRTVYNQEQVRDMRMADHVSATRPTSRRAILAEKQPNVASGQPSMDLLTASSPRMPHHESLKPEGNLSLRRPQFSKEAVIENKRISALVNEPSPTSNRNSAISTTSTTSGKSRRKTHVGPWQLGRTLGKGATGRVRLAKHALTGQVAAIKIVSKKSAALVQSASMAQMDKDAARPTTAAGFRLMPFGIEREVVIMKLIAHPNVINLYDVWENRGELYLVLEYVEGGELFDYVSSYGALPEQEAVRLFRQIIAGLSYCHRFNICHRDLKPENLLLDADFNIKLADFGMAALQPSDRWLITSCGSPHYAAPEIIYGKRYRGDKADIWSVGIILYAMLNGFLPFDGGNLTATLRLVQKGEYHLSQTLSEEASDLIQRILQKHPEDRISMNEIWAHPLITKYENYHRSIAPNGVLVGPPPPLSAKDCGAPIGQRADIDSELLRNLQSLWYGTSHEDLISRLLSAEANHEKLFYNALIKFREEQLENYPGAPLEYSASDYHHVAKGVPVAVPKYTPTTRSRSHFSIVSERSGKRTYYREPGTAASTTTKESYDPYRSSRTPLVHGKADHAIVVLRQGSGASRARKPGHAARLRHAAANKMQAQANPHRDTSSGEHRRLAQHRGRSGGVGQSRSSLASTRRGEVGIRKSVSHKRQVSFQHTRYKFPDSSSRPTCASRLDSSGAESSKASELPPGFPETQSTPSLPSPPRVHRPRKPASEFDMKKGRVVNNHWKDEARKLSSELGKICEEAFNGSSVSSDNVCHEKSGKTSATSVSVQPESSDPPLPNQLKNRPLPQPPPESLGSYTLRELAETRRRLLEHCEHTGNGRVPGCLTDVVAHLDRLMQTASKSDGGEKRSASDPNSATSRNLIHLAAANEDNSDSRRAHENQSNRSASDPSKPTKQIAFQDPGKTIRLVSPEASPHPQLPLIQPLNIRKKSVTTTNPLGSLSTGSFFNEADNSGHESRIHGGLDPIEEHPRSPRGKVSPESPSGHRKWSWFKRQSDPLAEVPPTPPTKNSPLQARKEAILRTSASHTSSHDPKAKQKVGEGMYGCATDTVIRNETKKKWFRKMFGMTSKGIEPTKPDHMIVHDMASETDSTEASSENLLAEPYTRKMSKHRTPSLGETEPGSGQRQEARRAVHSAGTRPAQINQNWFAKFFHIKPANRVICLGISKVKARREIVKILKDWRRYGLRDVVCERGEGGDMIRARVDCTNYLHLKPVTISAQLFTVLERGRKCNLSIVRFTQEQGAASSFHKVLETLEAVLTRRNFLITDPDKRKGIEKGMKDSGL